MRDSWTCEPLPTPMKTSSEKRRWDFIFSDHHRQNVGNNRPDPQPSRSPDCPALPCLALLCLALPCHGAAPSRLPLNNVSRCLVLKSVVLAVAIWPPLQPMLYTPSAVPGLYRPRLYHTCAGPQSSRPSFIIGCYVYRSCFAEQPRNIGEGNTCVYGSLSNVPRDRLATPTSRWCIWKLLRNYTVYRQRPGLSIEEIISRRWDSSIVTIAFTSQQRYVRSAAAKKLLCRNKSFSSYSS